MRANCLQIMQLLFGVFMISDNQAYNFQIIDLSVARKDQPLGLSGSSLIVYRLTDPVSIKFNDRRFGSIPLTACDEINPINVSFIPFNEIFLTNDARQGAYMRIIVLAGGTSSEIIEELQKPKGLDRLLSWVGLI